MRLEHRVGETALLPLDELQVQWVRLQVLVNLALDLVLERFVGQLVQLAERI